jgi:hypothetical protein
MTMEFGWWSRDEDGRRFQVRARFFGQSLDWQRKQGHHQLWESYGPPTGDDWDRLIAEAERRLPRRLLSPKEFAAIRRLRPPA